VQGRLGEELVAAGVDLRRRRKKLLSYP